MASRVRKHFVYVSADLAGAGLAILRQIDGKGQQTHAENLVGVNCAHVV